MTKSKFEIVYTLTDGTEFLNKTALNDLKELFKKLEEVNQAYVELHNPDLEELESLKKQLLGYLSAVTPSISILRETSAYFDHQVRKSVSYKLAKELYETKGNNVSSKTQAEKEVEIDPDYQQLIQRNYTMQRIYQEYKDLYSFYADKTYTGILQSISTLRGEKHSN